MKVQVSVLVFSLAVLMVQTMQSQNGQDTQHPQKQTSKQADTKADQKSNPTSETANAAPAEMKTMTHKGVLMDMSCGGHTSNAAATAGETPASATPESEKASANRSAADTGTNCPVSANSTEFGMKMDDGKTVRFDMVGNQRAQDELKNNKSWNNALSAGKPIHAKVSGVMSGDKLVVSSIH